VDVVLPTQAGLTRRSLLQAGATAALGALLLPSLQRVSAVFPAVTAAPGARHLSRSSYAGLVGERFAVGRDGHGPVRIRLVEIRDLRSNFRGTRPANGRDDAFGLRFHGPRAPRIEQAVHRLHHPSLGSFELLLAPSGTGRRGQDYEAIINSARDGRAR
jgi:hypothetical protein